MSRRTLGMVIGLALIVGLASFAYRAGRTHHANNVLVEAVRERNLKRAQQALANGADPNVRITHYQHITPVLSFPLIEAVGTGDEPMVRLLLQHKANPNCSGTWGVTPLNQAEGNGALVRLLTDAGAKR